MSEKKLLQVKKTPVRDHFKKHKKKYLIGAGVVVCVGAGAAVGYAAAPTIKGGKIAQKATVLGNHNTVTQTAVQVQMTRPGPKSFVVQCLETQETFPSLRQAAKSMGLNMFDLSKHLKGELSDVNGFRFEKLTEI